MEELEYQLVVWWQEIR